MKLLKFSFLPLLLSLLALPLTAENNGLNNKFVKNNAEAVMFLPASDYPDGLAGIHLNISSNDFSIMGIRANSSTVFNLSAQKSFIKVSRDGKYYKFECNNKSIKTENRFKVTVELEEGNKRIIVFVYTDYREGKYGGNYYSINAYKCDAVAFHSGGYYGLQNPKYDTNLKKSFKFFETFIKANFKKIDKIED